MSSAFFPTPWGTQFTSQYLQPTVSTLSVPRALNANESALLTKDDAAVKTLVYILERLKPEQRIALKNKDAFGRLPLHYAAQFGFVVVCQIIMARMQEWGQFNVETGIDAPEWQDKDGYAPLHLAVIGGHPLTTPSSPPGRKLARSQREEGEVRKTIAKIGVPSWPGNQVQLQGYRADAGRRRRRHQLERQDGRDGASHCSSLWTPRMRPGLAERNRRSEGRPGACRELIRLDTIARGRRGREPVYRQTSRRCRCQVQKADSSGWTAKEHARAPRPHGHRPTLGSPCADRRFAARVWWNHLPSSRRNRPRHPPLMAAAPTGTRSCRSRSRALVTDT